MGETGIAPEATFFIYTAYSAPGSGFARHFRTWNCTRLCKTELPCNTAGILKSTRSSTAEGALWHRNSQVARLCSGWNFYPTPSHVGKQGRLWSNIFYGWDRARWMVSPVENVRSKFLGFTLSLIVHYFVTYLWVTGLSTKSYHSLNSYNPPTCTRSHHSGRFNPRSAPE